jgi:ketosteroid isomerase-like protein
LRDTVAAIERRSPSKQAARARVTALALGVVAKDPDAARDGVPLLAMGEPSMVEHLTRGAFPPGEVTGAWCGGPFAIAKLFTPEAIDEIALVRRPTVWPSRWRVTRRPASTSSRSESSPRPTSRRSSPSSQRAASCGGTHDRRRSAFASCTRFRGSEHHRRRGVPARTWCPAGHATWFNLNQSNYVGVDHISELWQFLSGVSSGRKAECKVSDELVTVSGDAAWVVYALDFRADFGAMGKVAQDARCTEVWQRLNGDWRMVHFHCSNHVPGQMGGL